MAMSNMKRRRFQSTGFGLDRDTEAGDKLPPWKRNMFASMRNRAKQSRHQLLAALDQQKSNSSSLSPNSKKKHANSTIDSFRKSFVENEMKLQFTNKSGSNSNVNQSQQGKGFMGDEDEMSAAQYKTIFAELASYLEATELSDLRASHLASLEEFEVAEEKNTMAELEEADSCCCPLCSKHELHIEYVADQQKRQLPVYGCDDYGCGAKFRPRTESVMAGTANEGELATKMLAALKSSLGGLVAYHSGQMGCAHRLSFGVVEDSGYLQAWCAQCNCNEIVI